MAPSRRDPGPGDRRALAAEHLLGADHPSEPPALEWRCPVSTAGCGVGWIVWGNDRAQGRAGTLPGLRAVAAGHGHRRHRPGLLRRGDAPPASAAKRPSSTLPSPWHRHTRRSTFGGRDAGPTGQRAFPLLVSAVRHAERVGIALELFRFHQHRRRPAHSRRGKGCRRLGRVFGFTAVARRMGGSAIANTMCPRGLSVHG